MEEQQSARTLLLLLLLSGRIGGGGGTTSGGSAGGSSSAAGADVDQEVLDVLALESLFVGGNHYSLANPNSSRCFLTDFRLRSGRFCQGLAFGGKSYLGED